MADRIFLKLSQSEIAVLSAASRIFSAYVVADKVEAGSQERWIERSVHEATHLAVKVAAAVQSEREI